MTTGRIEHAKDPNYMIIIFYHRINRTFKVNYLNI
jgi:hypothetical protein